jgi:hypothetical protein
VKIKFRVPSRQPEQHEPQPEAHPNYPTYVPQPMLGCICPEPFVVGEEIFYPHDPCCLVPGHGCGRHRIPPVSVYFRDTRTVGVAKPARRGVQ